MLSLRRRPVKTHARLAREELNESLDHLVQAANHAAGGVGATVGPRVHAARERVTPAAGKVRDAAKIGLGTTAAALAPLAVAAREKSRLVKRHEAAPAKRRMAMPSGRWSKTALLLAGAAVGLAGAVVMRRRKQREWDEYDPGRPMDSPAEKAESAMHRADATVSTTAETLAEKTSSAIDSATADRHTADRGTPAPAPAPTPIAAPAPGMATPVPVVDFPSSNSRG